VKSLEKACRRQRAPGCGGVRVGRLCTLMLTSFRVFTVRRNGGLRQIIAGCSPSASCRLVCCHRPPAGAKRARFGHGQLRFCDHCWQARGSSLWWPACSPFCVAMGPALRGCALRVRLRKLNAELGSTEDDKASMKAWSRFSAAGLLHHRAGRFPAETESIRRPFANRIAHRRQQVIGQIVTVYDLLPGTPEVQTRSSLCWPISASWSATRARLLTPTSVERSTPSTRPPACIC